MQVVSFISARVMFNSFYVTLHALKPFLSNVLLTLSNGFGNGVPMGYSNLDVRKPDAPSCRKFYLQDPTRFKIRYITSEDSTFSSLCYGFRFNKNVRFLSPQRIKSRLVKISAMFSLEKSRRECNCVTINIDYFLFF